MLCNDCKKPIRRWQRIWIIDDVFYHVGHGHPEDPNNTTTEMEGSSLQREFWKRLHEKERLDIIIKRVTKMLINDDEFFECIKKEVEKLTNK